MKMKIKKRIKSKSKIKSRMGSMHAPESWFDHEKLEVYREAVAFIAWLSGLLEESVRIGEIKDQLDRASTSIALNLAEGNGKYALKTAAASSISRMAPRWNALPDWTFSSPKGRPRPNKSVPAKNG